MMDVLLKNGAQVNFNIPPEFDDDFPTDAGDEPLRLALKVRKDDLNSVSLASPFLFTFYMCYIDLCIFLFRNFIRYFIFHPLIILRLFFTVFLLFPFFFSCKNF